MIRYVTGSLRLRLVLAIVLLAAGSWLVAVRVGLGELRPRYLEAIEECLADTAPLLAAAAARPGADAPAVEPLAAAFAAARARPLNARIHGYDKRRLDLGAYAVDARGRVLWHSDDPALVGRDFSQWNDVILALRGGYGARATAPADGNPLDAVLHVAAPVVVDGRTLGAVTVFKRADSVAALERAARHQLRWGAAIAVLAAAGAAIAVAWWVTRPLALLTRHLERLRAGVREAVPAVGHGEIGRLAAALAELRGELEGRRQVEGYVRDLVHEFKAPLAAMRASGELLEDAVDDGERRRLAAQVQAQAGRLADLAQHLLELARLERLDAPPRREAVALAALARSAAADLAPLAGPRGVSFAVDGDAGASGDPQLLRIALANLLANALRHAPDGTAVTVAVSAAAGTVQVAVRDRGPGFPAWALPRLGERFFALPGPDGAKGTGLGLSLVREIARLHGGEAGFANHPGGGAEAVLRLPSI